MGHRNSPFTGHMINTQIDQQGSLSHPEPCIFYGNFPHPNNNINIHHPSMVPAPVQVNQSNFNFHHMPLPRDGAALFYGVPHQHPNQNLDLSICAPSGHYNHPYPFPNHGMVGIMTDGYGNSTQYVDIKRKNILGPTPSVGPSEFAAASALMDGPPPQSGSQVAGNMMNSMGMMAVNESARLVQGDFVGPPVGLMHGNQWPGLHFGSSNGDVGAFGGWGAHAPMQYVHGLDMAAASMNGASNRSLSGFHPPLFAQGHPNPHHLPPPPMQVGARGVYSNVTILQPPMEVIRPRISTITSPNTSVAPLPPMGFRLYHPQQREIMLDSSERPHTLPHLRVLPEDEVAILELTGIGESTDQHRDMRLDIDHMSYEELLALGDHIGCVDTGLPEGFIRNYLKTTTFTKSSAARLNSEEEVFPDEQINFCVVCQMDYEDGEDIGRVDCGHVYHKGCIKKWLLLKNTCPVCKSTALSRKAKDL